MWEMDWILLTNEICVDFVFTPVVYDKRVDRENSQDVVDLCRVKVFGQGAVDLNEVNNLIPFLDCRLVKVVIVVHQDRYQMVGSRIVLETKWNKCQRSLPNAHLWFK